MKKNIISIAVIIFSIGLMIGTYFYLKANHEDIKDSVIFKQTFEAYNTLVDENKEDCLDLSISEDNPFIIKSAKEIVEIMKNETALIFFGYPFQNATRSVVDTILELAKKYNVDKIYFLDIYNIKDVYQSNGTLDPKLIRSGSTSYHEITSMLKEHLNEYYVFTDNIGYDTGLKEVTVPALLLIKKGEVLDIKIGDIRKSSAYSELQIADIAVRYEEIIKKYSEVGSVCTLDQNC